MNPTHTFPYDRIEYEPKEKPTYYVVDAKKYLHREYSKPTMIIITIRPHENESLVLQTDSVILKTKSYHEANNSPILDIWRVMND